MSQYCVTLTDTGQPAVALCRPPERGDFVIKVGEQGPQGVPGPQGPQGEAGAGVTMLHQLSDTAISHPSHNDMLSYDQSSQKWVNRPEQAILDGGNF
ncbi:MAG: hypothetical protein RJA81_328 [Planctomycetota bacterium]